jgi:ribosome-interacting GTPase 1
MQVPRALITHMYMVRTLFHACLQLLDLPGIIEGAAQGKGKRQLRLLSPRYSMLVSRALHRAKAHQSSCPLHIGRGRQVIAVCKSADVLLMVRPHSTLHSEGCAML